MAPRDKKIALEPRAGSGEDQAFALVRVEVPGAMGAPSVAFRADKGGYSATNPANGVTAVWVMGEMIPDWALAPELLAEIDSKRAESKPAAKPNRG